MSSLIFKIALAAAVMVGAWSVAVGGAFAVAWVAATWKTTAKTAATVVAKNAPAVEAFIRITGVRICGKLYLLLTKYNSWLGENQESLQSKLRKLEEKMKEIERDMKSKLEVQ